MAIAFLKDAMIDEETIKMGMFSEYSPHSSTGLDHMVLDAHALQRLEVVEKISGDKDGYSLFDYVNRCQTSFGKR